MARDPMNGPGASQNDAGGVITEQVKQGAQTASQQSRELVYGTSKRMRR